MSRRDSILKAIVWETPLKNLAAFSLEKGAVLPVSVCVCACMRMRIFYILYMKITESREWLSHIPESIAR